MKNLNLLFVAFAAWMLSGCTSAFYGSSSSMSDDLYALHNRTEIANRKQAEAEARKAEAEARRAELEALIAEAETRSTENTYYNRSTGESYTSVLADDYESAYARRLRGMDSPSYRMPSSYMNARYSTTFHYVSAYDPAFYNVMVMGDEVWVEPKYVTAMFGTWGLPTRSSWYWNNWTSPWWSPSYSIGFGNWGWNIGFSWYDPWLYDWYSPWYRPWGSYYYGWSRPYWHHHYWHGHGPHWNGGGGYHPGRCPGYRAPSLAGALYEALSGIEYQPWSERQPQLELGRLSGQQPERPSEEPGHGKPYARNPADQTRLQWFRLFDASQPFDG